MTLNDEIVAYLTVNAIAWTSEDYETGQPAGEENQILYWSDVLGPQPTQAQLDADYAVWSKAQSDKALYDSTIVSTQNRLDTFAKTRGYDGILSACSYVGSPTAKFDTEGQYCVSARDATWVALIQYQQDVEAGTIPVPATYDDVVPYLPPLVWPA
jgi:hypothetical protein